MASRRPVHRYSVYVVELSAAVWNESRFRKANPGYVLGMPFVYVGMTGLDPDVRFDKHKAGIQSNRFVRDFGLRLVTNPDADKGRLIARQETGIRHEGIRLARCAGEDDGVAARLDRADARREPLLVHGTGDGGHADAGPRPEARRSDEIRHVGKMVRGNNQKPRAGR